MSSCCSSGHKQCSPQGCCGWNWHQRNTSYIQRAAGGITLTTEPTLLQGYDKIIVLVCMLWHHLQLWNYMNHTDRHHIWRPENTDLTFFKWTDDKEAYKTEGGINHIQSHGRCAENLTDHTIAACQTCRTAAGRSLWRSNNKQQLSDIATESNRRFQTNF